MADITRKMVLDILILTERSVNQETYVQVLSNMTGVLNE